jgi:hypothetical protein
MKETHEIDARKRYLTEREEDRPSRFRLSMRAKMMICGIALVGFIIVACVSGMSRLGCADLSPRALKAARQWTSRLKGLSQQGTVGEIAEEVVSKLDFSPYLSPQEEEINFGGYVGQEVYDKIRYGVMEGRISWAYPDASALRGVVYRVKCLATLPITVFLQHVHNGVEKTFDRTWMLQIDLDLEIDADQKRVLAWTVGPETFLGS